MPKPKIELTKMEDVIYVIAQQVIQPPLDLRNIAQIQDLTDPGQIDTVIQDLLLEFNLMQLDDEIITPDSTKKLPLENFETLKKLVNSFTPNVTKLVQDTEAIGKAAHFMAEGKFFTTKQVRKPTAFLRDIKKQESKDNIFMHKDQKQIEDTYNMYLQLANFTAYENNIGDKLSFLEVNLRKCKGYLETYHAVKDKQIIIKFTTYESIRYAVLMFNQFFNNHGLILRMKKYYLHQSQRVLTKEFKILHVPKDLKEETIKEDLKHSLKGIPFYIRATGGEKNSNKEGYKTIFFMIKNPQDCHRIKNR